MIDFDLIFSADNTITTARARDRDIDDGGGNIGAYQSCGGGIDQMMSGVLFMRNILQQAPCPESFLDRFQFELKRAIF